MPFPNEATQFKKGQSGNENGRPPGAQTSAVRLRRLLEIVQKAKNPVTKDTEDFTTLELMDAPADSIRERHGYNLGGVSFTPAEIAAAIAEEMPGFEISYAPDFRQDIADSWPRSIDDTAALTDWGWRPEFDLRAMVRDMLANLAPLTAS